MPEDRRRGSNFQLNIYDNLVEEGKIGKKFNDYFFSKGENIKAIEFYEEIFSIKEIAKKNKVGIWSGKFLMPWEWRKKNK